MAQIFPFRGALYDPTVAGAARDVVAPPYDIIDAAGQKALYDRNPHNVFRSHCVSVAPARRSRSGCSRAR